MPHSVMLQLEKEFSNDRNKFVFDGFTVDIVSKILRRVKKVQYIKEKFVVALKTFRKTFAASMAEKRLSIQKVANLLGHDSTANS